MTTFTLGFLRFKPLSQALVLGAVVTLSSTAVVLPVMVDRAEIDALHGRTALGILLPQDIAVLVLMVTLMAHGGKAAKVIFRIVRTLAAAGGLAGRSPTVTATPKSDTP